MTSSCQSLVLHILFTESRSFLELFHFNRFHRATKQCLASRRVQQLHITNNNQFYSYLMAASLFYLLILSLLLRSETKKVTNIALLTTSTSTYRIDRNNKQTHSVIPYLVKLVV